MVKPGVESVSVGAPMPKTGGAVDNLKLGVIRLDGWGNILATGTGDTTYVPIRGDIDDHRSYEGAPFTMVGAVADACSWPALKDGPVGEDWDEAKIDQGLTKAFEELLEQDVHVIVSNCGLFMWLHCKGLAAPAMDEAIVNPTLGGSRPRPIVAMSTLTMLASYLPLYGLGGDQKAVINRGRKPASDAVVAIFTSDEDACIEILKEMEELEGTNIFVHGDGCKSGVLVVGLNGDNVIGVDRHIDAFDVVNLGTPAFHDDLNPEIQKVAEGVKKYYPNVVMGIVECTEVSAYSDTIRAAMNTPVFDPIDLANTLMDNFMDHDYEQLSNAERQIYIDQFLAQPLNVDQTMDYYIDVVARNIGFDDLVSDIDPQTSEEDLQQFLVRVQRFVHQMIANDEGLFRDSVLTFFSQKMSESDPERPMIGKPLTGRQLCNEKVLNIIQWLLDDNNRLERLRKKIRKYLTDKLGEELVGRLTTVMDMNIANGKIEEEIERLREVFK